MIHAINTSLGVEAFRAGPRPTLNPSTSVMPLGIPATQVPSARQLRAVRRLRALRALQTAHVPKPQGIVFVRPLRGRVRRDPHLVGCSVRPSRPNPAPKHRPVNERAASQPSQDKHLLRKQQRLRRCCAEDS